MSRWRAAASRRRSAIRPAGRRASNTAWRALDAEGYGNERFPLDAPKQLVDERRRLDALSDLQRSRRSCTVVEAGPSVVEERLRAARFDPPRRTTGRPEVARLTIRQNRQLPTCPDRPLPSNLLEAGSSSRQLAPGWPEHDHPHVAIRGSRMNGHCPGRSRPTPARIEARVPVWGASASRADRQHCRRAGNAPGCRRLYQLRREQAKHRRPVPPPGSGSGRRSGPSSRSGWRACAEHRLQRNAFDRINFH